MSWNVRVKTDLPQIERILLHLGRLLNCIVNVKIIIMIYFVRSNIDSIIKYKSNGLCINMLSTF